MTIAPLLDQLRSTAGAEADRRLAAAREEAGQLLGEADHEAARLRETALRDRSAHWAAERERRLAAAREAGARETLGAAGQLVERVLKAALEQAPQAAATAGATRWAGETIERAMGYLPGDAVVAFVSAGLRIPRRDLLRVDAGSSALGVVLAPADGAMRVDATLERHFRAERARLAQWIVRTVGTSP